MYIYYLEFKTPLHLGVITESSPEGQEDVLNIIHSDTLHTAIMSNFALLFDDDIEDFYKEDKFIISSAFPYKDAQLFFSAPIGFADSFIKEDSINKKNWKKLDFIPDELLLKYLNNETISKDDFNQYLQNYYKNFTLDYYEKMERPRISVDRLTNSPEEDKFFYTTDLYFKEGWGLFFLVDFIDDSIINKFDASLKLLGDNGIGGDRAIGRGNFTFEKDEFSDFKRATNNEPSLLLSLMFPSQDEINNGLVDENCLYKFVTRENNHPSHYQIRGLTKKSLRMFKEGSIFKNKAKKEGINEIVITKSDKSPFNVYNYGKGFLVPFKEANNGSEK